MYNNSDGPNTIPEYLPGYLGMYHIQQQAPEFYQGVDINMPITLHENEIAVNYADFNIQVALKDDLSTVGATWVGSDGYGINQVNGTVIINIPGNITQRLPAQIYYIAVLGTSKKNLRHSVILFSSTISIKSSAASTIPSSAVLIPVQGPTLTYTDIMEVGEGAG
jgi:hypothetical protein